MQQQWRARVHGMRMSFMYLGERSYTNRIVYTWQVVPRAAVCTCLCIAQCVCVWGLTCLRAGLKPGRTLVAREKRTEIHR